MSRATLYCGDALAILQTLPEESVQTVMTSPPYWGLRDYGMPGQLGLEATPEIYVEDLCLVFAEVRRVLRDDGTLWLNIGDCYAGSWGAQSREHAGKHAPNVSALSANQVKAAQIRGSGTGSLSRTPGLKPKDLVGIPWRVAFALQVAGWWLRKDIIWSKPNPMPESATDRPTTAHEYVFLLSKSERYYWDADAIAEPCAPVTLQDGRGNGDGKRRERGFPGSPSNGGTRLGAGDTRNARSVWTIGTQSYAGAHFATFPEELARRCILAGSSPRTCEHCGAPWKRIIEARGGTIGAAWHDHADDEQQGQRIEKRTQDKSHGRKGHAAYCRIDRGFTPTCGCEQQGTGRSVVLDPFGGSGTVAQVATGNGRDSIYIDLNPQYLELAQQRIGPMLCEVT